MTTDQRIAIVGGGPAGAYLAHRLGLAGALVDLYEPRGAWEKPCGGGVPPKVRRLIPEIAQYPGPRNELSLGVFISPAGRELSFESGRPLWIVSRRDLDGYLLDLAQAHPTVRLLRTAVRGAEQSRSGWTLHCADKRAHRADFLVAADGAASRMRGQVLGPLGRRNLAACVGWFCDPPARSDRAISQFLAGSGYIWAYPRHDHLCLGAGTWGSALPLRGMLRRFAQQRFPGIKLRQAWAAPIPFVHEPELFDRPCSGARFAALGDAAGHVDALTGEGILYALWGAKLLAERLLADDPNGFDDAWRDAFGRELRRTAELSLRFYRPANMELFFKLAGRSRTMSALVARIMTDQPEYSRVPLLFASRLPLVAWDLLWGRA